MGFIARHSYKACALRAWAEEHKNIRAESMRTASQCEPGKQAGRVLKDVLVYLFVRLEKKMGVGGLMV